MTVTGPRPRGLIVTGSALALLTIFCVQFAKSNLQAWQAVLEPGPASLDQALAATCGSLALALSWWLLAALALSLLLALGSGSSAAGRAVARGARLVVPQILRNAVAALLGVAIVATPACANAQASPPAGHRPPALTAVAPGKAAGELSPAWIPDRKIVVLTAGSSAPAALHSDLWPGWFPQRPPAAQRTGSSPGPTPSPVLSGRRGRADRDEEIVVRRGDTLWSLAERHLGPGATDGEIALEWPRWFAANRSVIGSDPNHLRPGERLRPPERMGHDRAVGSEPSGVAKAASGTGGGR